MDARRRAHTKMWYDEASELSYKLTDKRQLVRLKRAEYRGSTRKDKDDGIALWNCRAASGFGGRSRYHAHRL